MGYTPNIPRVWVGYSPFTNHLPSWWFPPIWKILVKLGSASPNRGYSPLVGEITHWSIHLLDSRDIQGGKFWTAHYAVRETLMAWPPVCSLRRLGWQHEENMPNQRIYIVRAGAVMQVNNKWYDDNKTQCNYHKKKYINNRKNNNIYVLISLYTYY